MRHVRPEVGSLEGYVPGEQPPPDSRLIKLNTNENPYPPSPRVAEAVGGELARLRLYPPPLADDLRSAAAEAYDFPMEGILAGNGSDELLTIIIRACVSPGERIAYPAPSYSLYSVLARLQGAESEEVPFREDFSLPAELFGTRARVVFVANPNSPSGSFVRAAELRKLAESIEGVTVIDEAYADFADENALSLARELGNVVVLRSLSKSFSLAGVRVGLAFGTAELIAQLMKVKDSYNLDRLAIAAGKAALEDIPWMLANRERVLRTRGELVRGLEKLGFRVLPSEANFVFATVPSPPAKEVHAALRSRGILVRHFDAPPLADGLRITVGTDEEIRKLLDELADILRE